jgi:hypothetical protein
LNGCAGGQSKAEDDEEQTGTEPLPPVISSLFRFATIQQGGLVALYCANGDSATSVANGLIDSATVASFCHTLLKLRVSPPEVPAVGEDGEGETEDEAENVAVDDTARSSELVVKDPNECVLSDDQWVSLLDIPVDLPRLGLQQCSAVLAALLFGHKSAVEELLSNGVDPGRCDASGMTPLMAALAHGLDDLALKLVTEYRVDVDRVQQSGWNALKYALIRPKNEKRYVVRCCCGCCCECCCCGCCCCLVLCLVIQL